MFCSITWGRGCLTWDKAYYILSVSIRRLTHNSLYAPIRKYRKKTIVAGLGAACRSKRVPLCGVYSTPSGMMCWWGRAGCPENRDQFTHLSEHVFLITKIWYAWQHIYYHLSRPDSDRLMLLVNMFAKLILLSVKLKSDLHATFAMAAHPPAGRACCPNPANTNGNGGPDHTQSQPPPPLNLSRPFRIQMQISPSLLRKCFPILLYPMCH